MTRILTSRNAITIAKYITEAKALPIFEEGFWERLVWSEKTWDIKAFVRCNNNLRKERIAFHHHGPGRSINGAYTKCMMQPFEDLVKAYIGFELFANIKRPYEQRFTNIFSTHVRFARNLDRALCTRLSSGIIEAIDSDALDMAVELTTTSQRKSCAYALQKMISAFSAAGIVENLSGWRHSAMKADTYSSRIQKRSPRRGLTSQELRCLAEAYNRASRPEDVVAMSILALLACAPSRISEALILPADVEVVRDGVRDDMASINYQCGLRWWPVKGGPPQVKFVPKEMFPVAVEALTRIRHHTDAARIAARWMTDNPGQVLLPDNLKHLRDQGTITKEEISILLGTSETSAIDMAIKRLGIRPVSLMSRAKGTGPGGQKRVFDFREFERACVNQLPSGWPQLSKLSDVEFSDALCLSFKNQFSDNNQTIPWSFEVISANRINLILNGKESIYVRSINRTLPAVPSIFERLDIRLPDGRLPSITTHQLRHYLNTVAQRSKVPQAHIAYWSGRRNLAQNEKYDHSDAAFEAEQMLRGSREDPILKPLVVEGAPDTDYQISDAKLFFHSTPYGYCYRRFLEEPCDRAGACRMCTSLVCLGGSRQAANLLKADAARDELSLKSLQSRIASGRSVSDRLVKMIQESAKHSRALAIAIEDPINLGKLIENQSISVLENFSHEKRIRSTILMERQDHES